MKNFAQSAAIAATLVAATSAVIINSPAALVQCQPALLTFSQGTAPYYIRVLPGGQPSAAAIVTLPTQQGTSYTWTVNVASGTNISLSITDGTGAVNYAAPLVVQSSSDTSCLRSSGSSVASSSSSAVNTVTSGRTTTTAPAGSTTTAPSSSTPASQSSAAPTSSRPNGAAANVANIGVIVAGALAMAAMLV